MKGIYFNKQYQKYHVRVTRNSRTCHVGRYNTIEEAMKAKENFLKLYPTCIDHREHQYFNGPKSKPQINLNPSIKDSSSKYRVNRWQPEHYFNKLARDPENWKKAALESVKRIAMMEKT